WLVRGGTRISTLDVLGPRFSLLVGAAARAWTQAAVDLPEHVPPVCVVPVGPGLDISPGDDEFARLYELEDRGPVLIRPDGHVAWRFGVGPVDAARSLQQALATLTGRGP